MKSKIAARLAALGFAGLAGVGALVYQFEGESTAVYSDPAGITTACIGHVNKTLELGQKFTEEECAEKFGSDLSNHEKELFKVSLVELTEQEKLAYTSFHFNVGAPNFNSSTLLKLLNAGDRIDACIELTHACSEKTGKCGGWTYSNGWQYAGLVNRRRLERNICLLGALHAENIDSQYRALVDTAASSN